MGKGPDAAISDLPGRTSVTTGVQRRLDDTGGLSNILSQFQSDLIEAFEYLLDALRNGVMTIENVGNCARKSGNNPKLNSAIEVFDSLGAHTNHDSKIIYGRLLDIPQNIMATLQVNPDMRTEMVARLKEIITLLRLERTFFTPGGHENPEILGKIMAILHRPLEGEENLTLRMLRELQAQIAKSVG